MMGEPYLNDVPIKEAFPKAEHWSVVSPEVVVRFRSYRRYSGSPDGSHCVRNRRPASVTPPRSPAVLSASLPRCHGPLNLLALKIDEASNDLRFVKHVTQSALKNADADSRENIENAIYNLIFKAQFKATGSISMQQTPAGFTLRTYTHATRQKQDEAAQTMGSFMAQVM